MKKIILALAMMAISTSVYAATTSKSISPSFAITSSCNIDTTGLAVDFGSVPWGSVGAIPLSGSLSVSCLTGLPYAVGFNAGLHWDGTVRYMMHTNGTDTIPYTLNSSYATPVDNDLGDDMGGFGGYSATTNSLAAIMRPTGDAAPLLIDITPTADLTTIVGTAGTYSDVVTVVVVW
jgi:spore coat protein U-like protein